MRFKSYFRQRDTQDNIKEYRKKTFIIIVEDVLKFYHCFIIYLSLYLVMLMLFYSLFNTTINLRNFFCEILEQI